MAKKHQSAIRNAFKLEIISSFPLQMAIYFNLCIYPMHFINICLSLYFKYKLLTVTYQVIAFSACLVHICSEGVRLGLGFYGNLAENMSALFGFVITSIIIQIPLTVFLASNSAFLNLPLEYIFYAMIVMFSGFQTIFAIRALSKTADREVAKYLHKIEGEKDDFLLDHQYRNGPARIISKSANVMHIDYKTGKD